MMDFLHGVLWVLLLVISGFGKCSAFSTVRCIESEKQALLSFKKGIVDPGSLLTSWTSGEKDCCRWSRVECDRETGHVFLLDIGYNESHPDDGFIFGGEIGQSLLDLPYLSHLNFGYSDFKTIPKFIGELQNLTYLNINVIGQFPYQLGNLSKLQYLSIDGGFSESGRVRADSIEWLSRLSWLTNLTLSSVEFSQDVDWLRAIKVHPSLTGLQLLHCKFPTINSSYLSLVKSSESLVGLSLHSNTFNSSIFSWLFNLSSALVDLIVFDDQLNGSIPNSIGELEWLQNLDLSHNDIGDGIPTSFRSLCRLKTLDLSYNGLSEPVGSILQKLSCSKKTLQVLRLAQNQIKELNVGKHTLFESLKELDLSGNLFNASLDGTFLDNFPGLAVLNVDSNQFVGEVPDFENLSSLRELYLRNNSFSGNLGESIAKLSHLKTLQASSNSLHGAISETHLSTLSKLQFLDLSGNPLVFNISVGWIPPFQLEAIILRSCKLGPSFPSWLKTQNNFSFLDISDAEISDEIPSWFWNFPSKLEYLNISFNHIRGQVLNLPLNFYNYPAVDLSSNLLYGSIPQFSANIRTLNLSWNKFSGTLSFLCTTTFSQLSYLDLSDNLLSGGLTDCWVHLRNLIIVNIENNNLSGMIPASMGFLSLIETLQLRNNSLTGALPASMANCTYLILLDLGDNHITGQVPLWIGESLTKLIVLRLRSNMFNGSMPSTMCQLGHLQLLDLSFNNLQGAIPTCLNNFTAMASDQVSDKTIKAYFALEYVFVSENGGVAFYGEDYINHALILWKGFEQMYKTTLGLLKLVDLSNNKLVGEIPSEVTDLLGLISLNLSRNSLSGIIPDEIGQLKRLDTLDLSHNQLFGKIPPSLADISRLSILDLSDNKLSGRIPTSTQLQSFGPSAYAGNPGLCGCPLPIKCSDEENNDCSDDNKKQGADNGGTINLDNDKEEGLLDMSSFYGGMGGGFAIGFLGFCGFLIINTSWRRNFSLFLNKMEDYIYLIIILKLCR